MVRILGGGSRQERGGGTSGKGLDENVKQLVEQKLQEVLQQELARIQLETLRAVAQAQQSEQSAELAPPGGGTAAGGGAGGIQAAGQAPPEEDPAAALARLMGDVEWDVTGELTENLNKLKQVIQETQAIANKLEALVGTQDGGQQGG